MPMLEFDCLLCETLGKGKKQKFGLTKGVELTEHEWFAQCLGGCDTFGIKIVDDAALL